jgi:hypothetical protein
MITSMCIYRVKRGSEAAFRGLLAKHWPTLKRVGLGGETASTIYEGTEADGAPLFIELLHWKDAEGPNRAHELPAVMAVWEPMGKLCESRGGRPAMEFPVVERIEVAFER